MEAATLDPRFPDHLLVADETQQVTGSVYARGAMNKVLSLPLEVAKRGLVAAASSHHGVAVAYAAKSVGVPATIFVLGDGETVERRMNSITRWGARAVRSDDDSAGRTLAADEGLTYVSSDDPEVLAGHGTLAVEILEAASEADVLIVAMESNAPIAAIARAAKLVRPSVRVVAACLGSVGSDCPVSSGLDSIARVDVDDAKEAARWLQSELGVAVDLVEGAAAVAAVVSGGLNDAEHPCVVLTARRI
jgi:threonine dehydratase